MKYTVNEYGEFEALPEGTQTVENVAVAIILSSYNHGQVWGAGVLRAFGTDLTKDMALKMLNGEDVSGDYVSNPNKKNKVYMDYVFGRCCKTAVEIKDNKVVGHISTRDQNPEGILSQARKSLEV